MGYKTEAVKGIIWIGILRVFTRGIALGRTVILARILSPAQFGVFGIALLVLAFVEILTETGINVFLVQKKDEITKYINTAWIVSIARGLAIMFVIFLLASPVTHFFNAPNVYPFLLLISIVPFIRGFINPAIVKFLKELEFNKEFYFRVVLFLFDSTVAVIVTVMTKSAVGIIWGLIAGAFLEVILSFMVVKPVPRFAFEKRRFMEVIHRGKWMTAAVIFNYLFQNGDNIAVGKLLGTFSLGLYDISYKISILPITEVGDVMGKVVFPIYAKISDDIARLKIAFVKTVAFITILVLPIGAILFLFPREIISFFGPQWAKATPILQFLALFGVVRAIINSASPLFLAVKKQEYVTSVTFLSFATLAFTVVPLTLKFGVIGAAYSAFIATISTIPLIVYYLLKIFNGK